MRKLVFVLAVGLVLAGCAKPVPKNWAATGGSRADATVELSYEYYVETEQPVLKDEEAMGLAVKRCRSWGYADAEAFGGVKYQDFTEQSMLTGRMTRRHVTKTYQCIGQGSETR